MHIYGTTLRSSINHKNTTRKCTYSKQLSTYISWYRVHRFPGKRSVRKEPTKPKGHKTGMLSTTNVTSPNVKLRVLCLHGMRTSGKILSMQTAAIQHHTPMQYEFIDAPYPAAGPPDKGIAMFYPNHSYYEWFLRGEDGSYVGLNDSVDRVLQHLAANGPYDGLLGFSQGASMVTRLVQLQRAGDPRFTGNCLFRFVILIGAVPPVELVPVRIVFL
jgi:hypothetical protein